MRRRFRVFTRVLPSWIMRPFTSRVYRHRHTFLSLSFQLSCLFLASRFFPLWISPSFFNLFSTSLLRLGPLFISFSIFLSFPLTNVSFSVLRCSHTSSAPRLLFLWPASFFFCLYRSFILSRVSSAVINLAGGIPEGYLTLIYELAILRRPRIFFFFFLPLSFSLRFLAPFVRFLTG